MKVRALAFSCTTVVAAGTLVNCGGDEGASDLIGSPPLEVPEATARARPAVVSQALAAAVTKLDRIHLQRLNQQCWRILGDDTSSSGSGEAADRWIWEGESGAGGSAGARGATSCRQTQVLGIG